MRPVTSVVTIAVFVGGMLLLWRERSNTTILFLGVIVVMPVALAIISRMQWIYARHFIIGVAFLLLLLSFQLGKVWNNTRWGKTLSIAGLLVYCAANGPPMAALFNNGYGHYREAMRYIIEHTHKPDITIGSDHDFRFPTVLNFYAREIFGDKPAKYYLRDAWPPEGPEWALLHKESFDDPIPPLASFVDGAGNHYDLEKTFPAAPLSGLHWFLYQQHPN